MTIVRLTALSGLLLLTIGRTPAAERLPSYAKHVKPFLAKYCLECHNASQAKGELVLESFKTLLEGGKSGLSVVPGKPDESRLVLLAEGKQKPKMPPKDAKQPKPGEADVLRAWVAAGAKDDSTSVAVVLPDIKPRAPTHAPISALAYRPDGKLLAAGGHREVTFLDVASGDVLAKWTGLPGKVTALTFSRDGKRLAVASGAVGTLGEVRLYALSAAVSADTKPEQVLKAHQDIIYDVTFSPDGKLLATCGYDRLIKLWDAATGKELRVLKDHSDTIYGLAFSPDGKLLASAAADRAVKVWDVATGKRLYTLGEATDWLYTVAWSPNGKHLAAAGVDRSIRVWEVSAAGGQLVHSVFAHEGPVSRLLYAADGTRLYSLSEDRTAKAWDAARITERKVYATQPDAVLTLAVRPDHKQIALGRYDGTVALLDEATGVVQATPLPAKPKPPQLVKLSPTSGRRGQTVRITFEGKHLEGVQEMTSNADLVAKPVLDGRTSGRLHVEFAIPTNLPAGVYQLGLKGMLGETAKLPFTVDLYAATAEVEPNDSPSTGQSMSVPVTLVGALGRAGDTDFYRLDVKPGQQVGVQVVAAPGSKFDPVLQVIDYGGRIVAESERGFLGFHVEVSAPYVLGIRDRDFRGGPEMRYHLHAGDIPVVTSFFPLGLARGSKKSLDLNGVNLPPRPVWVEAAADATPGSRVPAQITTADGPALGSPSLIVGEFPEVTKDPEKETTQPIPVPGTANGFLRRPGATDIWRFTAKKGQQLILEVNARRLGSPLDSVIEILDAKGQPVPRATLRCLAKTYVTFRDHDSAGANLRIEAWSEFAVNDYVFAGSELLRIRSLPTHPDADCIFFSDRGQRVGYLDTTSTHQPMGQPLYKVALHPPGTTFPPNGFPVITLPYRNDDGGAGYGKDSRLYFDPPADGDYQVRVGDARGHGGSGYAYRLTVRPPRPSYNISFNPTAPAVWKGGALPITATAERIDGYDGEIEVRLTNLPAGFSAPVTMIPAGENSTAFALFAEPNATVPAKTPSLKLLAKATINGQDVVREVNGGTPKVVEPGDIVTATKEAEVTLKPGGIVRLTVQIERRNDFKGRIPLDVRGLPHGVRVLDIGLNGILITEKETTRTIRIYAEPWVQPTEHPIVVLARREGKNTEHAAKSVLLKVRR